MEVKPDNIVYSETTGYNTSIMALTAQVWEYTNNE
jgi:hypothetical protein